MDVPERLRHLLPRGRDVELSELLGPAWRDLWIRGEHLVLPGWKTGFEAGELRALFWDIQELPRLRHEVKRLAAELERRAGEQDQLERDCAFYRRQVRLESHMGMMLAAIAAA